MLVEYYMAKAMKAQAEFLDKVVLGGYPALGIFRQDQVNAQTIWPKGENHVRDNASR